MHNSYLSSENLHDLHIFVHLRIPQPPACLPRYNVSNMIQARKISFSHTGQPLYQNASFTIPKNKTTALVGLNGAGKSTLFNLFMGREWPEDGKLKIQGKPHLVPQEVKTDPIQNRAKTIASYLSQAVQLSQNQMLEYLENMELGQLNLEANPNQLSGGQKTKLAILYAVLSQPEILLLDEPTNFLDTAGKKWVMNWLSQYKQTLILISHDLDLLDQHIDRVLYINKQTKQIETYTGTYTKFKRLKAERDQHLTRHIKNQQKKMQRMQQSVEKLRRSNVDKVIRQRVQLERRIQKMSDSLPELPQEVVNIKLTLPTPAHIGRTPLIVRGLDKGYPDNPEVLSNLSFSIQKGERICLIGHNGAGKTTLIKTLMGYLKADKGKISWDTNVKIGYYSQELDNFDPNMRLLETLRQKTPATDGQIRSFLAKFMFTGDKFRQTVGSLSGGEKTRLSIATLMLKDYNFLMLDEPTTYLDTLSQRIILEALKEYQGTILIVSHTPDFLKQLKPDKALLLPDHKFVFWDNSLLKKVNLLDPD